MTIILNNVPTEIEDGLTVGALALAHGLGPSGSAVAVNERVIRRADWDNAILHDGDKVLIIKAAYGG